MVFTFCVFINVIFVVLTYVLLCHTALLTIERQDPDDYIYKKNYVLGDIVNINNYPPVVNFLIAMFFCIVPVTWCICISIWFIVVMGYFEGILDVFGKNKLIY